MKSGILSAAIVACGFVAAAPASAQGVKIGILNDQSGVYADYGGKYSLEAAQLAVEDFGGSCSARRSRSSRPTIRTSRTSARPLRDAGTMSTTST